MTRKKPVPTVMVASLQDADKVLEELADLERRASGVKNSMNERIDAAKAEAAEEMLPIEARKKELEGALSAFALMHKGDLFKEKKSRELDFGTLSFRLSTRIVPAGKGITLETMLEKVKELGFLDGVRLKEELNKEAMAGWDDDQLAQVGAKRRAEDVFGYTLKQQDPGQTMAA
jgi:phage host-nuclease inhibitor protein Gam